MRAKPTVVYLAIVMCSAQYTYFIVNCRSMLRIISVTKTKCGSQNFLHLAI